MTTALNVIGLSLPTSQHEANLMAAKLFCLFSFILVGLIVCGIV
jgi:hypothetical protein